jgi:putative PEP-CTERM system histidine kinase
MPDAWSYGVTALAFSAFAIQLIASRRENWRAILLLAAVALSALWAVSAVVYSVAPAPLWWRSAHVFDSLRQGAAIAFLMVLTDRAVAGDPAGVGPARAARFRLAGLAGFVLVTLVAAIPPEIDALGEAGTSFTFSVLLMRSILGLVAVEHLFRRTQPGWRWNVRPLCLGFAAIFVYDLILFADALMYRGMDANLWTGRGVVNALVIPLLGLAAIRNREWRLSVRVSRSLLAGSTALFASGLYLMGIAGIGYYVRYFGGSWGGALQVVLVFAGVLLLGLVLLSGTFRSKLRVFVSKHFFAYRYDYREEWLKITRTLSEATAASAPQMCVRALADLVESPSGALWLRRGGDGFAPAAQLNMSQATHAEPAEGPLAQYMRRTAWVIDLDECRADPSRYPGFVVPDWLGAIPDAWLVVPLPNGDEVVGFVVLAHARVRLELNWEVLDLLKTAGRQVASYLAMNQANDALLEARKFDAFNRMSAFVVHDLKNLVAQLQLLLRNAERHRDNPDFQRDMLRTVEHAVARMSHLMAQLRAGATPIESPQAVDLATIARRVQSARPRGSEPVELELDLGVYVIGHQERLERVVGHLVQNSLDAVRDNPRVRIRVFRSDGNGVVEVEDNGVGMSSEFVRERLFRPFQTTKEMGMGIGAYESMQYVSTLGGRISVDSRPGQGTVVRVSLPLAVEPQVEQAQEEPA